MKDQYYFCSMETVEKRLEKLKRSDKISEENKRLILKFIDHCISEGLSTARLLFYLNTLPRIAQWSGKSFKKLTRDDIEKIIVKVEKMGYSVWHTQVLRTRMQVGRLLRKNYNDDYRHAKHTRVCHVSAG